MPVRPLPRRMAEIRSLGPGLWLVESSVEDFDVRGVVVAGTEAAVVWDTLARPRDMAGVSELVSGLPLTVVYSHGDWDHVWGTRGLAVPWTEILAHEACLPRFAREIPETLREKSDSLPEAYGEVALLPPTRTIREVLGLELGGITLELHPLPGHTPDSLVGFIPQWGVLLAGDSVETPLPFLNPGSPAGPWADSLERWAAVLEGWKPGEGREGLETSRETAGAPVAGLPLPAVLPSHGPLGGPELLRTNARYLRDLLAGREPSLPAGMTPFYRRTHTDNLALVGRR